MLQRQKNNFIQILKLKKIDSYLFKQFISLLVVTFFVVLFIIVMQFVWLNIDDLLGKGVPLSIMGKFLFYVSMTSTPLALPLAIMLAALMTFGGLGEKFELIAMKTSGISLFRIMRSLLVFIAFVIIGAFFYSNYVIPVAQKRMYTLLYSFREKSLELEVPIGEFYSGIKDRTIYARGKDSKRHALLKVMIYDFSKGFENASITAADTVYISTTEDKRYLKISMINGESFENGQQNQNSNTTPYRRETFKSKDILLDFDSNFKELDESMMNNQHISKNIQRLSHDIDSVNIVRDSLKTYYAEKVIKTNKETENVLKNTKLKTPKDIDSLFLNSSQQEMKEIVGMAQKKIEGIYSDAQYNTIVINDADYFFIRHNIEWHTKFTLSFACLIFFFIGAPLGAIIGKGGLGLPAVVSVILFVIYYIINTMGIKMAKEAVWNVWQGMWFSSAILLPIGIFLTYKAVKDSALFESDAYKNVIQKAKGILNKIFRSKII